jgi:hypothetical protein
MPAKVGITGSTRAAATPSPKAKHGLLRPDSESFDSSEEFSSSGPGSRKSGTARTSLKLSLKQRYNKVKPRTWLLTIFTAVSCNLTLRCNSCRAHKYYLTATTLTKSCYACAATLWLLASAISIAAAIF